MRVIERADRMRERVDGAEPFLEGGSAHRRGAHHVRARLEVVAVGDSLRQILEHEAHALDGDAFGHRMIARRAIGFEAMGERVHAGARGDEGRHADGQFRIADDHARHHLGVKDHLLGLRRLLGDDAGAADLRARSRRGRHGNHRGDLVGVGARPPIADILEIPERPRLPGHEGDDLAGIEAGAAAESDDPVMAALAEGGDAGFKIYVDRVRLNVGEHRHGKPRVFQDADGALGDGELSEPRVGDQQRPIDTRAAAGVGELLDTAGAESDGGRVAPIGGRCAHVAVPK